MHLALLLVAGLAPQDATPTYRVAFSGARRRIVHVDASLPHPGELLVMSPEGAEGVERRWAAFVEDLRAVDAAGEPVALEPVKDRPAWRVPKDHEGPLELAWRVTLDHDKSLERVFGVDEAPYFRDDCVFVPTAALFLGPEDLRDARVSCEVPDDWIVSTPWPPAPGERWAFEARDHEELCRSVMLVGEHVERTVDAARAQWTVAVGGELVPHVDELTDALVQAAEEAELLFGKVPAARYLLVANRGRGTGGSARVGAMSLVLQFPPGRGYDHLWRHTLVHELVHMWNGVTLRRRDRRCEWFAEGVTDYLALLLLGRSGLAGDEELLALMARSLERYRGVAGDVSLADAGLDKRANLDAVYAGGMWMGLLLDLELRRASKGEESLETYVQRLMREHPRAGSYELRDLEGMADRLGKGKLRRFFQRHVRGRQPIPVEMYLAQLGLEAAEVGRGRRKFVELRRREEVSEGQERMRWSVLGVE